MSSPLNQLQAASIPVYNAQVPAEGPKALKLPAMDFSAFASYVFDGQNLTTRAVISMVQSMYLDTRGTDSPVTVIINDIQNITVKGRTQGYYPVLCSNPFRLVISCADQNFKTLGVILINVPVAPGQWPTQ